MFRYPERVSGPTVERRGCGQGRVKVSDRAREAILEEAGWIDEWNQLFQRKRRNRNRSGG